LEARLGRARWAAPGSPRASLTGWNAGAGRSRRSSRPRRPEELAERMDIVEQHWARVRVAERVGRMVKRQDRLVAAALRVAVDLAEAGAGNDSFQRVPAERNENARPEERALRAEPWRTGRDLHRCRWPVPGGLGGRDRPALDDVRDVDVAAVQADAGQQIFQQPTRPADKWPAAAVLFPSGAFTHDHHPGVPRALAGHSVRSRAPEVAPPAPPNASVQTGDAGGTSDGKTSLRPRRESAPAPSAPRRSALAPWP